MLKGVGYGQVGEGEGGRGGEGEWEGGGMNQLDAGRTPLPEDPHLLRWREWVVEAVEVKGEAVM